MAQLNDLLVLGKAIMRSGIKSNGDHDLISHDNQFNFIPKSYSGDIYINYRAADGNGAITNYRFCNGNENGALANIVANSMTATTFNGNLSGNASSANTATQLSSNTRMDYGWNGLNYFNINGTVGNAAKTNDTPTSAWWHILRFNHANSSGYYTDLAVPFNANSLYYKRITAGAVQNKGWVKVLDALNYNSYSPKLDGTGASGTWGISITGNAATSTNATTANKISDITEGDKASNSTTKRRIWFCYDNNKTGRPAYDDRFTLQTSTGTLFAPIFSGSFTGNGRSSSWWDGRDNALLRQITANGYSPAISIKTTSGSWEIGHYNSDNWHEQLLFNYKSDTSYAKGDSENSVIHAFKLFNNGQMLLGNKVYIGPNNVSGFGNLCVYGGAVGGYNGIHFGNDSTGMTVMSCEPHQGLYNESAGKWIIYYKRDVNLISIGNSTVRSGFINMGGSTYIEGNLYLNNNEHAGIGLYNTSSPNTYGIHMSLTKKYGTHGPVASDWATYFCFDGDNDRGWIFKHANTNVASINGTGKAQFDDTVFGYAYSKSNNKAAFMWDKPGTNYTGVGANGTADTIYFGACDDNGSWITNYQQKWRFNGEVQALAANAFRLVYGNYGIMLRNDGSEFYFLVTASKDQYGTWNSLRPFYFNLTSGRVTMANGLTVTGNASISNTLTVATGSSHYGVKLGSTYLNAINDQVIFQNNNGIRFGTDDWDWNCWAGLKYQHRDSNNNIIRTISLGIADGTVFSANASQSNGTIQFPGISNMVLSNTSISGANSLSFADPGPDEGIIWTGGNGWKIYESPDNLTTNSGGNLQFVQNTTRRMTLSTSGGIDLNGGNVTANNFIGNAFVGAAIIVRLGVGYGTKEPSKAEDFPPSPSKGQVYFKIIG